MKRESRILAIVAELGSGIRDQAASLLVEEWRRLDPELISAAPEPCISLILGQTAFPLQPALCSAIIHQPSSDSLRFLLRHLLRQLQPRLSPTLLLDWLGGVLALPRLRLPQDRTTPRHRRREDILRLTPDQTLVLVHWIAAEAQTRHDALELRLPLLQAAIADCPDRLSALNDWLKAPSAVSSAFAALLFQHLQFHYPKAVSGSPRKSEAPPETLAGAFNDLDAQLHGQVMELFRLGESSGKSGEEALSKAAAHLRCFALSQPAALARQLSLISALLRGTTTLSMRVFGSTCWLQLFDAVLGVLEALRSAAFQLPHRPALLDILSSFFDLIKVRRQPFLE